MKSRSAEISWPKWAHKSNNGDPKTFEVPYSWLTRVTNLHAVVGKDPEE